MFSYLKLKRITSLIRTFSNGNVRVRFAPSPTGYLHLGGLRTALYNYLFAKSNNGTFILRIEDTDQTRLIAGATEQLEKDLLWSGISIQEGPTQGGEFGPYYQSQRLNMYRDHIDTLLENGTAYHCFCTDRRLDLLRREAQKLQQIPKYDNRCRHLSKQEVQTRLDQGQTSCIRFKISDQEEMFDDLVYGKISYNISLNEGDPVIMKTDGFPTYHFANVVDDHLMNISHVLRGVEWQISTTKHLLLYRAFGWKPPFYGHLPLLMNADGTKLSKRQGDIKISHYREKGIFPLALINFIVHSGGGFSKDLERHLKPKCYTIDELSEQFNLSQINSHSGKLMTERLSEFNQLAIKRLVGEEESAKHLVLEIRSLLRKTFPDRILDNSPQLTDDYIKSILHWSSDRIKNLSDLVSKDLKFIWVMPSHSLSSEYEIKIINHLKRRLKNEEQFEKSNIKSVLKEFSQENNLKFSSLMKMLRSILSGHKEGPSVADMVEILGKENTLKRLDLCLKNTSFMR